MARICSARGDRVDVFQHDHGNCPPVMAAGVGVEVAAEIGRPAQRRPRDAIRWELGRGQRTPCLFSRIERRVDDPVRSVVQDKLDCGRVVGWQAGEQADSAAADSLASL